MVVRPSAKGLREQCRTSLVSATLYNNMCAMTTMTTVFIYITVYTIMEDNTLFRHSKDIRAAFELTAGRRESADPLRRHNVIS